MRLGLSRSISWIWANTDNITKWIQIVALAVAGYWTYIRFIRVDAPTLEPVSRVEFDGPRFDPHDESCRVKIGLKVFNEGHSGFAVSRVQIQGWQGSPAPQKTTVGNAAYFNTEWMREGVPMLNVNSVPDSLLNRNYPPGTHFDQTFSWDLEPIRPIWMFQVTLYDKEGKPLNGGTLRQWGDGSCGK
jgi:hypothetical protein